MAFSTDQENIDSRVGELVTMIRLGGHEAEHLLAYASPEAREQFKIAAIGLAQVAGLELAPNE